MGEKSLLIVNETSDVYVTFYILPASFHKRRWLSVSKIIEPGKNYLHRQKADFRYEITVHNEEKEKKTILPIRHWERDLFYEITSFEGTVHEKNLSDCYELKQICCKKNRDEEISSEGFYNLYEILELELENVRNKKETEQNEDIKKAYKRQMLRWHPDKNPTSGDPTMCQDIQRAYEILRDPESRAAYHNVADYDKGWLFKVRSIFWTECASEKQKKEYRKRLRMMMLSALMASAGFILTFFTAGAAFPAAIVAGVLIGVGMQSLPHTISRDAIQNGVDTKKYLKSGFIGAVGGATFGSATAGIVTGMAGIHLAAVGTVTASAGGGIMAVTNDVDKIMVSGKEISLKEILAHTAIGFITGGLAGAAGGAVANAVMGPGVVGEAANKVSSKAKQIVSKMNPAALVEETSLAIMTSTSNLVEERLDDSKENKSCSDHMKDAASNFTKIAAKHTVMTAAKEAGNAFVKSVIQKKKNGSKDTNTEENVESNVENRNKESMVDNETENSPVNKRFDSKVKTMADTEIKQDAAENVEKETDKITRDNEAENKPEKKTNLKPRNSENKRLENKVEVTLKEKEEFGNDRNTEEKNENKEDIGQAIRENASFKMENQARPFGTGKFYSISQLIERKDLEESDIVDYENNKLAYASGRIRYISKRYWYSRMLVKCVVDNETKHKMVSGSGKAITIPGDAKNIEISFQVMRFILTWCDVKKYDRFNKCWSEPTEPHIFRYDIPRNLTFTLAGPLYYEAVMNVTENFEELHEL